MPGALRLWKDFEGNNAEQVQALTDRDGTCCRRAHPLGPTMGRATPFTCSSVVEGPSPDSFQNSNL